MQASGFSAYAFASQIGGSGGYGFHGNGGAGQSSTLTNVVTGSTGGGTLYLAQIAHGLGE